MKVLRLHGVGDLRPDDEPEPAAKGTEVRLRVQAVGVCGSDLHWLNEGSIGDAQLSRPLVLGHEFSALTDAGDRVAVNPAIPCGECEMCVKGHSNLCRRLVFAGHGEHDGAMREVMTWPARNLHPLPATMTLADGAMLEPLGIALHAVDLAKLKIGMTVGVYGCGPLGLLIVQVARLAGAGTIIATDLMPHRVEAAAKLGATHVLRAAGGDEGAEIQALTGGRGVDVAIEAAGEQTAVETAFNTVGVGGRVLLLGIPADDRTSFPASTARRKGLSIKLVRRMKPAYARAIALVEAGRIDVRSLVTHRFPLERAAEAFGVASRREGLKVLLQVGQEAA